MRGLFLSSPLVGEGSKTGGPDVAEEQGAAERRVSVVINTYNRGPSLRQTLRGNGVVREGLLKLAGRAERRTRQRRKWPQQAQEQLGMRRAP